MKKLLLIFLVFCLGTISMSAQTELSALDNLKLTGFHGDSLGHISYSTIKNDIVLSGSSGTVVSVGLALPTAEFDITGSPITESGTLTGAWKSQNQNLVFASPDGSNGTPGFRALVSDDIPQLPTTKLNGSDVTVGSNKITLGGTPTGASLTPFSIDVNEGNLNLANIGGTLGINQLNNGTANQMIGANGSGTGNEFKSIVAGSAGSDFAVNHTANTITLDLPSASATARGVITNTTQTIGGLKTFSDGILADPNGAAAAQFRGVVQYDVDDLSASTTLSETHSIVPVDCSLAAVTLTMPAASANTSGRKYTIIKTDNSANLLTVDLNGIETFIDGSLQKILMGQGTQIIIIIGSTTSNNKYIL